MNKFFLMLLFVTFSFRFQEIYAQVDFITSIEDIRIHTLTLDSMVNDWIKRSTTPGIQLSVIENKKITYTKSFGYKNFSTKEKVNDSTVFKAASLSKPVLGYLTALLADEGMIDLDKPLYQYLPHPELQNDPRSKLITARMILNHTSGIPAYRGYYGMYLIAQPGLMFSYSGEGYFYLQNVLEFITGTPFEQLAQEKIFIPLGMFQTSFEWQLNFNLNYAIAHDRFNFPRPRVMQIYGCNAAASLITTSSDYAKFVIAIMQKIGLSERTYGNIFAPSVKIYTHGAFSQNIYWGLGWALQQNETYPMFFHWGDDYEYKCFVAAYPNQGKAVVYFTNGENGLNIKDKMVHYTIGGKAPTFHLLNYWQIN